MVLAIRHGTEEADSQSKLAFDPAYDNFDLCCSCNIPIKYTLISLTLPNQGIIHHNDKIQVIVQGRHQQHKEQEWSSSN